MTALNSILISGAIGAVFGATIFFAKDEPHKIEIVIASIIRNILVGLLVQASIAFVFFIADAPLYSYASFGALYGLLSVLIVYMPNGFNKIKDEFIGILSGVVCGIITGVVFYFIQ